MYQLIIFCPVIEYFVKKHSRMIKEYVDVFPGFVDRSKYA